MRVATLAVALCFVLFGVAIGMQPDGLQPATPAPLQAQPPGYD